MEFSNYAHLSVDDWSQGSISDISVDEWIQLLVGAKSFVYETLLEERIGKKLEELDMRNYTGWDDYLGIALMAGGMIWLVPGAGDVLAALIGVAIFKHPYGAVIGLAVYNAIAISAIGFGYYLTELD